MLMDLDRWQADVQERLRNSTAWLRTVTPGMAYGALATCTLLPLVTAHRQFDVAAAQAIAEIFGGVGLNLFSQQVATWFGKKDEELAELLGTKAAADPAWRDAFDELLTRVDTPRIVQAVLPEADWDRLGLLLQQEIQAIGSGLVIEGDWVAGHKIAGDNVGGDKVGGDKISGDKVGGDKIQIDNIILNPPDPSQPNPQLLLNTYLSRILRREDRLSLEGIKGSTTDDPQFKLSAIYTALLTITPEEHERWSIGERLDQAKRYLSAVAQLDQRQHLVLLGDPGSGKSTFIKFVALCMAGEALGDRQINLRLFTTPLPADEAETAPTKDETTEPQPWRHKALLPIIVILRDFAADGLPPPGESATAEHLMTYICRDLAQMALTDFEPYLHKALHEKGCLLLLDGLDEVPDANQQREQLKSAIIDFVDTYTNCRVLITSRTYAYQKPEWRLPNFTVAVLAPFSAGQIHAFIEQWYTEDATVHHLNTDQSKGRTDALKHAIMSNPRLYDLAERPLLLTLMVNLHAWNRGQLPERREELYNAGIDLLLNQWERQRVRKGPDGEDIALEPSLSEWLRADREQVRRLIDRLAFDAHARQSTPQGTADVPEEQLVHGLFKLSNNSAVDQQQLINYLSDRAGILVNRGHGVYSFPHRTFQEYMASCHLTYEFEHEEIAAMTRNDPNRWREVALLAAAQMRGLRAVLWGFIESFCDEDPKEKVYTVEDEWGAHLAGQMIADNIEIDTLSPGNQRKLRIVGKGLTHVLTGSTLPATERAAAGRALAKLGDPRDAVLTTAAMHFCYVPAGPFVMGSDPTEDNMAQSREQPQHELNIPHAYWLSRFPATNSQFDEFVADKGYANAAHWHEAAAHGYWQADAFKGRYDSEPRTEPVHFGDPFHLPNHPVVGISWYEALAYTRWLTEQLPANWQARLPSEAEWEKAARGGLQIPQRPIREIRWIDATEGDRPEYTLIDNPQPARRYPWGHAIDVEKCSYNETNLGSTSAVGAFAGGASPYGVEELSGSVWEWTGSVWGEDSNPEFGYPYHPDDGREDLASDSRKRRVLRGGAFDYREDFTRASYRFRVSPYDGSYWFGFRLLLSPFAR